MKTFYITTCLVLAIFSASTQAARKAASVANFPSIGPELAISPLTLQVKVSGANKEYSAVLARESNGKICLHRAYRYDGKTEIKKVLLNVKEFQKRYGEFAQIYSTTQSRQVPCEVTVHVAVMESKKQLLNGSFCAADLNAEESDRFNKWLSLF